MAHLAPPRAMMSPRACLVAVLGLFLVAGCHGYTSIFAENTDTVPYVVVFRISGAIADQVWLPANGHGGIATYPEVISGTVELLTLDCMVVATASTGPGRALITVVGGSLRVENGVDLSRKSGNMLPPDDTCRAP